MPVCSVLLIGSITVELEMVSHGAVSKKAVVDVVCCVGDCLILPVIKEKGHM